MAVPPNAQLGRLRIGPCDNADFFRKYLTGSDILENPLIWKLNHGIYTGRFDDINMASHAYYLTFGRGMKDRLNDEKFVKTGMLVEMLGWQQRGLGDNNEYEENGLLEEDARARYIKAIWRLVTNPNTHATLRTIQAGWLEEPRGFPANMAQVRPYVPGAAPAQMREGDNVTLAVMLSAWVNDPNPHEARPLCPVEFNFETAYQVLCYFISQVAVPRRQSNKSCVVHALVAFCKRGVVSQNALRRVSDALRDEIQFNGEIDNELISFYWSQLGRSMDSVDAQAFVARWTTFLPQSALRIRILLNQTANAGLTQIITIGRSMKMHPTFPWGKVAQLFPGEIANATNALTTIGDDIYFGFNPPNPAVVSSRYKNVAYWCKELLVRCSGEQALNNFRGWTRNATMPLAMENLINTYMNAIQNIVDLPIDPADTARADALLAAVNVNAHVVHA